MTTTIIFAILGIALLIGAAVRTWDWIRQRTKQFHLLTDLLQARIREREQCFAQACSIRNRIDRVERHIEKLRDGEQRWIAEFENGKKAVDDNIAGLVRAIWRNAITRWVALRESLVGEETAAWRRLRALDTAIRSLTVQVHQEAEAVNEQLSEDLHRAA